jgi:hypothetical protein
MTDRRPTIDLEIRPDGTVHFEVTGAPGRACEDLEALLLEILKGEVISREHNPEFYQAESLREKLQVLLGRR